METQTLNFPNPRLVEEKLVEILNTVPQPSNTQSIRKPLDELFPEQKYEEKDIQKAKEILGALANEFSTGQLKDIITEIRYLAECWLDDFEREMFSGLTLKELLHEKGKV